MLLNNLWRSSLASADESCRRTGWRLRLGLGRVAAVLLAVATLAGACSGNEASTPVITLAPPTTTAAPVPTTDVATTTLPPTEAEVQVFVSPGDNLAEMVDAADVGTSFLLGEGIHRLQTVRPKDRMSFAGLPGAVMSGAIVLDGFQADGAVWRLDGIEMTGFRHGDCVSGYEGCSMSQDLFMDDVMLWQVTARDELEEGYWFWGDGGIYVANDPTARRVELSVAEYAFIGSADDVTISSLTIEKYATPAQSGTVQAQDAGDGARGAGWLIADVEITGSHGAAVRTGDSTTVINVNAHHNGQMGLTVSGGSAVVIEDSEIAFNNTAGFDAGWEAGGMKATRTVDLVVRNNHVHHNNGPGLWTDIDAVNTLYEDNLVTDNGGVGIFHEISGAAIIRRNTVERNGFDKSEWLWGAGILVAASSDVAVYDNTVLDNADGIAGIQQERGAGPAGPRLLRDLAVYENTVRMPGGQTGVVDDTGDDGIFTDRGITFKRNTYLDLTGRRFAWDGRSLNRSGWLATGQGEGSKWETAPSVAGSG